MRTHLHSEMYQDYEEPEPLAPWEKLFRCGRGHFVKRGSKTRGWVEVYPDPGKPWEGPTWKEQTTEKFADTVQMWCDTCQGWFTIT